MRITASSLRSFLLLLIVAAGSAWAQTDLVIAKLEAADPATAGAALQYTIVAQNAGPNPTTDVVITDVIPAGTTFVGTDTTSAPSFTCAEAGGTVTCTAATFVVTTEAIILNLALDSSYALATVQNTASIAGADADPVPGNNSATETTNVVTSADLSVAKTDDVDPVPAGGTVTYTVDLTNLGPSDATNVVLTDTVPSGGTVGSSPAPAGFTCVPLDATTIQCTAATLAAGATATFTIPFTLDPATTGPLSNSVSVTSDTADPDGANNSDVETTTVALNADLAVVKTDDVDPVTAGGTVTYTVDLTNNGPSDATNVVLTDTVPSGGTVGSSPAPAGFTCVPLDATTIQCTAPTFASGATATFTIPFTLDPGTVGPLSNTVTVTSDTPDSNGANDTDVETTTVALNADLAVVKTDDVDPVAAGGTVTYTVDLTNNGPSDATNVVLTDTVPSGGSVGSSPAPAGFTCVPLDATTIQCTAPTFASGATATFTIPFTLDPGTVGPLTNTVTVTSDTPDSNGANDTDVETTTVALNADLAVVKTDDVDPVTAGGTVTYTVDLTNNGPSDATNVVLTDTVPSGGSVGSSPAPAGFTCVPLDATTIQCTAPTFASGATATFTIPFTLDPGTVGPLSNTVTVTSDTPDSNAANDTDTETTTVTASADLGVTKTDSPDPVMAGNNLTYTITVNNAGPSQASSVVLDDAVPAETTFVSLDSSGAPGFTCTTPASGATGAIQCTSATLASAATANFVLVVNVNPGATGPFTNTATISSATADPDATDDAATATTALAAPTDADVAIAKTAGAGPFAPGDNIPYTITVTNNGPAGATAVSVADTLPPGTTFVSATPSQGTCSGTGPVNCSIGALANGASATITLVVTSPPTAGSFTNNVSVTAAEPDPTPANNAASATATTVATDADVEIVKTAGPGPFAPGDDIPYTITVTNNGPANATAVAVVDTLPAGTTFVSATPSQGTCSGTGPVNCSVGTLASGASATIALVVTSPATAGTFVNNATVSAAEPDPNAANNAASASATTGDGATDIPLAAPWVLLLLAVTLAVFGATRFRV